MTEVRRCIVCRHELTPTQPKTCIPCVADTRRDLARIETLYAYLPGLLGQPDGAALGAVMGGRSDEASLPGGDALAMLGPGSGQGEGRADDPPAVSWELWCWIDDVAGIRGETLPASTSVPTSVAWLTSRCGWLLSYHPAADEFVSDLRRILIRLEAVTSSSPDPERSEPCPICRTTMERAWTKHGLADDATCPRCKRTFSPERFRSETMALLAQAETEAAGFGAAS